MLGRPKGIAIDSDGHVYVADAQLNRMQAFSPEGTALISVGSTGYGPAQFQLMAGLTIDRFNRIIIVDQEPARIEIFRYITDAEAEAAKKAGVTELAPPPAAGKSLPVAAENAPKAAESAPKEVTTKSSTETSAPATSGPSIEELQKELADLKAKLAAQSQTPDAAKAETVPAKQPSTDVQSLPK